jgi:hypothetical protein
MTTAIAALAFALACIGTVAIYFLAQLVIEVDGDELRVGKAHIPLKYVGEVHVLTQKEMLAKRTRGADPAAYLAIRFWTPRGVVIEIKDTRDVTPYWLVTSRQGKKLALAIKD